MSLPIAALFRPNVEEVVGPQSTATYAACSNRQANCLQLLWPPAMSVSMFPTRPYAWHPSGIRQPYPKRELHVQRCALPDLAA